MRTRFAPSPTGLLHLGHAASALAAWRVARNDPAQFVLRIEDIDQPRCSAEYDAAIEEDLAWLGLRWETPVMRQSERQPAYAAAIDRLSALGLTYPCCCSRKDIAAALSAPHAPRAQVYPGTCRHRTGPAGPDDALRLNLQAAIDHLGGGAAVDALVWTDDGPVAPGTHGISTAALLAQTGDAVLARKDIRTSYLVAVVVDDHAQGIEVVTRGADLLPETPIQVLLHAALGLPVPRYHHHALIRDADGKRLAKRDDALSLRQMRVDGATSDDIRAEVALRLGVTG